MYDAANLRVLILVIDVTLRQVKAGKAPRRLEKAILISFILSLSLAFAVFLRYRDLIEHFCPLPLFVPRVLDVLPSTQDFLKPVLGRRIYDLFDVVPRCFLWLLKSPQLPSSSRSSSSSMSRVVLILQILFLVRFYGSLQPSPKMSGSSKDVLSNDDGSPPTGGLLTPSFGFRP